MFEQYIQPLTTWLHAHPHWAGFITFLISFSESLAIIGTIIPGSVTMTAIGLLVGSGVIGATPTFVYAILGAIAGDGVSFWLGYYYQAQIKDMWPFRNYPQFLAKGEVFFRQHGGKSVFIGRFAGPIRSIIPVVAGTLNMNMMTFTIANVLSAIAWSFLYLVPGILLGAAALELSPETAGRFVLFVLGSLIALWLLTWLVKWLSVKVIEYYDNAIDRLWKYFLKHPRLMFLARLLQDPCEPEAHGQLLLITIFSLCLLGLIALVLLIQHSAVVQEFNQTILHLLQGIRTPSLDRVMVGITLLGNKYLLQVIVAAGCVFLVFKKQWRTALFWLLNGFLMFSLTLIIKYLIYSPRPAGVMVSNLTSSFPSGHSALFAGVMGFCVYLLARQTPKGLRRMVYLPFVIITLLIGFSRLYLAAHWFTDVIASYLVAGFCVSITVFAYRRQLLNHLPKLQWIGFILLVLISGWSWLWHSQHEKVLQAYRLNFPTKPMRWQTWWTQQQDLLPLFRDNRFGHPVAEMNLQWAASIDQIRQSLEKLGWQEQKDNSIYTILNRIAAADKSQHLPVLPQLYRNQRPILTMTKRLDDKKPLLVLRLWTSGIEFTDNKQPLWIGSVHYRILWQHVWLQDKESGENQLPDIAKLLRPLLVQYQSKVKTYSSTLKVKHQVRQGHDVSVLLLRDSSIMKGN